MSKVRPHTSETTGLMRLIDCLSAHTIHAIVSQRRIPHVKVGRLVKFDVALLDAWIKQNTVTPMVQRRSCRLEGKAGASRAAP